MSLTIMLVTLVIFLIGVATGWRFPVVSVFLLIILILVFAAIDVAIPKITLWPIPLWVIVDLVAVQVGYVVGVALRFIVTERRKSLEPRKPA